MEEFYIDREMKQKEERNKQEIESQGGIKKMEEKGREMNRRQREQNKKERKRKREEQKE